MPFLDVQTEDPEQGLFRENRDAVVPVRGHVRTACLMTLIDTVSKHELSTLCHLTAQAAAKRHLVANTQQGFGQPTVGLPNERLRLVLDKENGPFRVQSHPGKGVKGLK